jgi:hypothetical protein
MATATDVDSDNGWWHGTYHSRTYFASYSSPSSDETTLDPLRDQHSIEWHLPSTSSTSSTSSSSSSIATLPPLPSRHIQAMDFVAAHLHTRLLASQSYTATSSVISPSVTVNQLKLDRIRLDTHKSTSHLSYSQVVDGIPVYGGEVRIHFSKESQLTGASGVFIPGLHQSTARPLLSSLQAETFAISNIRKVVPDIPLPCYHMIIPLMRNINMTK